MKSKFFGFRSDNRITLNDIVTIEGKQYFKTHATLIREGVFNGQLLTFDVLADRVERWNGRPIIMPLHLKDTPTTTWDKEFFDAHHYGHLDNVQANRTERTITADLYIDHVKLANSPYKSALNAIVSGQAVNGSIGFFTNQYQIKNGTHDGVQYQAVINQIIFADHYAILPYDDGACSVKKGCGVGLSKEGGDMPEQTQQSVLSADDLIPAMTQAMTQAMTTVESAKEAKPDSEGLAKIEGMVVQLSEDVKGLTTLFEGFNETQADNKNKLAILMQAKAGQPPHQTNGGGDKKESYFG